MLSFQSLAPISSSENIDFARLRGLLPRGAGSSATEIMLRATFPPSASTFLTRICTLSPTLAISDTFSTRPAARDEMWTRPSNSPVIDSPSWEASNLTNAPKSKVLTTSPSTNFSWSCPASASALSVARCALRSPPERRGLSLRFPPEPLSAPRASASSERMVTATWLFSKSIDTIRTETTSPFLTTSSTLATKSSLIRETCKSASV
mmetsp:Transcript_30305/g.29204  ORF Transcript_30305/g.29204 Transcript_30305/m.29204 type:complete len:207 (-) Transcript_30305:657-1277(-)